MEATIFVLQEVANEVIQTAFFFRVDVGLGEDFVDRVDGTDGALVRVGHALDLDATLFIFDIYREQIAQIQHSESIMNFHHKLLMDKLGVLRPNSLILFLGFLPHFLLFHLLHMLGLPLLLPIFHRSDPVILAVLQVATAKTITLRNFGVFQLAGFLAVWAVEL